MIADSLPLDVRCICRRTFVAVTRCRDGHLSQDSTLTASSHGCRTLITLDRSSLSMSQSSCSSFLLASLSDVITRKSASNLSSSTPRDSHRQPIPYPQCMNANLRESCGNCGIPVNPKPVQASIVFSSQLPGAFNCLLCYFIGL